MKLLELLKKAYALVERALKFMGRLIGFLEKEQEEPKKDKEENTNG